jgi:hypothetical protein
MSVRARISVGQDKLMSSAESESRRDVTAHTERNAGLGVALSSPMENSEERQNEDPEEKYKVIVDRRGSVTLCG